MVFDRCLHDKLVRTHTHTDLRDCLCLEFVSLPSPFDCFRFFDRHCYWLSHADFELSSRTSSRGVNLFTGRPRVETFAALPHHRSSVTSSFPTDALKWRQVLSWTFVPLSVHVLFSSSLVSFCIWSGPYLAYCNERLSRLRWHCFCPSRPIDLLCRQHSACWRHCHLVCTVVSKISVTLGYSFLFFRFFAPYRAFCQSQ